MGPWGTPKITVFSSEYSLFKHTNCVNFKTKETKKLLTWNSSKLSNGNQKFNNYVLGFC